MVTAKYHFVVYHFNRVFSLLSNKYEIELLDRKIYGRFVLMQISHNGDQKNVVCFTAA